jgi:hypothetical protein
MENRQTVTNSTAPPVGGEPPEMPGRSSESDGVVLLQCFAERHKLAEVYPGNILKIKDRRCKITFVFNLNEVLRLN